jgi:hypothetical protein
MLERKSLGAEAATLFFEVFLASFGLALGYAILYKRGLIGISSLRDQAF